MPANAAPYEILAAPFTLWVAPVGTTFPDVDEVPVPAWVKVGSSGDINYTEDGVAVAHSQSLEFWRGLGSTGPRKAFRPDEDLVISLELADLSLEQYALVMSQTVTTNAPGTGTPGTKEIGLSRGATVAQKALLLRGASPYGDGMTMQYEVPVAVQSGNPEPTFRKNQPAGLAVEFTALEDPNAATANERFGRIVAQHAAAL